MKISKTLNIYKNKCCRGSISINMSKNNNYKYHELLTKLLLIYKNMKFKI